MDFSISSLKFSSKEETFYKPEFENLSKPSPIGLKAISQEDMRIFLAKLKLSDHDMNKVLKLISERDGKIYMRNFMAAMRLCSLIRQGIKYSLADMKNEQRILVSEIKQN